MIPLARIRTIKPDFWTDSAVMKLSRDARLLFIGMLNFADDAGNFVADPKELKVRILPMNDVRIEKLIQELLEVEMLLAYEVEGRHYLNIRNFTKHQVINRPTPPKHPFPPWDTDSLNTHGELTAEGRKGGEGRERKDGKRDTKKKSKEPDTSEEPWSLDSEEISKFRKEVLGEHPDTPDDEEED